MQNRESEGNSRHSAHHTKQEKETTRAYQIDSLPEKDHPRSVRPNEKERGYVRAVRPRQ